MTSYNDKFCFDILIRFYTMNDSQINIILYYIVVNTIITTFHSALNGIVVNYIIVKSRNNSCAIIHQL